MPRRPDGENATDMAPAALYAVMTLPGYGVVRNAEEVRRQFVAQLAAMKAPVEPSYARSLMQKVLVDHPNLYYVSANGQEIALRSRIVAKQKEGDSVSV